MAFYYVKFDPVGDQGICSDASGAFATKQSGAFSNLTMALVYPSLVALETAVALVSGDVIYISNKHHFTYATETTIKLGSVANIKLVFTSVDDAIIDIEVAGAKEEVTTGILKLGSYVSYANESLIKGITFKNIDNYLSINITYTTINFIGCTFDCGTYFRVHRTSIVTTLYKCIINAQYITHLYSGVFTIDSCTLNLSLYVFYGVGATVCVRNSDLSGSTSGVYLNKLAYGSGNSVQVFESCIMPTNFQYASVYVHDYALQVYGYAVDNYYAFFYWDRLGFTEANNIIYLNYKYDDINKLSCLFASSTDACIQSPLKYKLCEIPAQDLSVTDTTYRVNLLLDTATAPNLFDTEFWTELSHNDNTSLALGKVVSSRNTDILSSGTELATSTETWQGTLPATYKAYQADITLSASSLPNVTNGSVVVYANLAVPNVDVYVCQAVQIGV